METTWVVIVPQVAVLLLLLYLCRVPAVAPVMEIPILAVPAATTFQLLRLLPVVPQQLVLPMAVPAPTLIPAHLLAEEHPKLAPALVAVQ